MEKRKIVFYLTIGMILILHLTACTNRSSELPAPDSTVFGYEGETKIIFDGVCAKYNDKKEKNQVFLPIVQVLGTYEEGNITKIVSCVSLTEMSLEEGNLTIAGTKMHGSMPIHMLQARQHQRQIHIIILTFSMIIRDQMLGIV